jgi:hypothetical protein
MDEAPIEIEKTPTESAVSSPEMAVSENAPYSFAPAFAIAAWIVPGLGHLLQRRWIKAAGFFVAVAGLAMCGYAMRGEVFALGSDGPFGTLGFLADAGSGAFYFLSRLFESAGPDLSRAAGDYGTRLLAAAGVMNILAVIDAYETASRRRPS